MLNKMFKKFRNWMHGGTPYALSMDEWTIFEKNFKIRAPIRYFISYVLDGKWRRIKHAFNDGIWWIRYRTINRYHRVNTGLPPGWHDISEVLLHTNFQFLVDFVEIEKANMEYITKYLQSEGFERWKMKFFKNSKRSSEEGLAYLDWEIELGDSSPVQSKAAKEIKNLYIWWTVIRPHRNDMKRGDDITSEELLSWNTFKTDNPEKYETMMQEFRNMDRLDNARYMVDQYMLKRLIDVRQNLWT